MDTLRDFNAEGSMAETRKELWITMPDGSVWGVPAVLIADNRARYYAEKDADTTYDEEMAFLLGDDFELEDWAANNMNWEDVAEHAYQVKPAPATVDYQEGWVNGEKEVVEVDTPDAGGAA